MEPYEIIDCPESSSGKAMIVRGRTFHLGSRNGFSDEVWAEKLQAKANYFATLPPPPPADEES